MAEVKTQDNKIIVEINVNDTTEDEAQPPKDESAAATASILSKGSSLASGLPGVGKYVRPFTQIIGSGETLAGQAETIAKGGLVGGLTIASIVALVLRTAHDVVSSYVKDKRQSDELKRRAGFERKQ